MLTTTLSKKPFWKKSPKAMEPDGFWWGGWTNQTSWSLFPVDIILPRLFSWQSDYSLAYPCFLDLGLVNNVYPLSSFSKVVDTRFVFGSCDWMIFLLSYIGPRSSRKLTFIVASTKLEWKEMNGKLPLRSIMDYMSDLWCLFGLSNAHVTFMRLMNEVLGLFIGKFVAIHFDDVLMYNHDEMCQVQHLSQVL